MTHRLLIITLLLCTPLTAGAETSGQDADSDDQWVVGDTTRYDGEARIDTRETTWSNVTVSPDGKTLVFDMLGDIYAVPIEGGEARALTDGIEWNYQPRYSPDGQRIAFVSDRDGGDNLWIMDADGGHPRAVTDEAEHLVHNPAWSPDGDYLVGKKGFYSTRSIPAGEIWMFHHGGGNGVNLVERPNGARDQKNRSEPAFSPDGKYVYYSADITPGLVWQYNKDAIGSVFAVRRLELATGISETVVSGPGGAIRPTPSPDGKSLAYLKRRPGLVTQIMLKDLESGQERLVYDGFERDLQESSGSEGNAPAFAWMPGSDGLVFWSAGRFHRLNISSGDVEQIPVRVRARKALRTALRFPVPMGEERFEVQAVRWASRTPDEKHMVFQALGHIWLRNLETGAQERLTKQEDHYEFYPVISPGGDHVLYTTWNDERLGSVRMVRLNGRGQRTLTTEPGHYAEPAFSPDGQQVLFRKFEGGYLLSPLWSMNPGIYRVAADGKSAPRRVTETGSAPHFSADGQRVYFSTRTGELGTERLLRSVNLDGEDGRDHLKGSSVTQFRVSPDGRWVAFTENYRTYVAPFMHTGKTISIGGKTKDFKVAQLADRTGEFLTWSANSTAVEWSHGRHVYRRALKEAFAFLDGAPESLPEPVTEGLDLAFEQAADMPSGSIAIIGGRVVTMRDADAQQEVIEDGVVLIEGHRIAAVGAREDVDIPRGAHILDAAGKTVLPGLVDAHAHGGMGSEEITPGQNWMQLSNLSFGVTTIHDPSNDTSEFFAAAELQRAGQLVAPRIYGTGTILYGAYAPAYRAEINSIEDARFHVQRLKDIGGISVKSYNQPRRDQRQQVIQAASETGMMVMPEGGMRFQYNMSMLIDGHTTLEHSIPIQNVYDDVRQLWSQVETAYTPTFGVAFGGLMGEEYWYDRTRVWENPRLMRFVPRSRVYPRAIRRPTAPDAEYNHISVAATSKSLRDVGVRVNIGAHGQREGLAAHWEIWSMAQGGFTPWEALRGATIDPAISLGMEQHIGSIEPGKLADLAIIEGNPLEDIRQSEFVSHTVINGRLYETSTMNQLAPDEIRREPLYFEREGGDAWSEAAAEAYQHKARALHWQH